MHTSKPAVSEPPACLLKPLKVTKRLLMGAGPSNVSPRVLAAGALPMVGHAHPDFAAIKDEVKAGIQYAFQTRNDWTFCISGTGNAAMEASVVNLLEPGDVALVCQNGFWGKRMADMVDRNGSIVKKVIRPMGEVFSLDEVEMGLREHQPKLVFLTYGESSSGTAQPMEGFGDLCHKYGALLLVDAVAILGGAPLFMDDWDIDVLYAGSQKTLSVPPSVSPISFSRRARDSIANRRSRVRSYYFDATLLANLWGCDAEQTRYHHTVMITSVYALREGLALLAEKGLEQSWKEHHTCAEMLYRGLEDLGLQLYVKNKTIRNPCLTTVRVPEGVDSMQVTEHTMRVHKVELSGGLDDLEGKVWRIGIMGHNCTPDNISHTLAALKGALDIHWQRK